jgi:hypothetical protein
LIGHPGSKGDASEGVWIEMLDRYLPKRYQARVHVVDSLGNFSQQIDVVVCTVADKVIVGSDGGILNPLL